MERGKLKYVLSVCAFGAVLIGPGAIASSSDATLSLVYENDTFYNRDSHYTNGIRVSYIPGRRETPGWAIGLARAVPGFPEQGEVLYGYSFGQNMYTASDITVENPPRGDRPYAGWLYGTLGLAVETGQQLDLVSFTLGVVGPASLAEQTQKTVHKLVNSDDPKGWDSQLHNEPGLIVAWQRSWRALVDTSLVGNQFDFTPHIGASLGNVYTYANTGLMFRYGDRLPFDYGPPRIAPGIVGTSRFVPRQGLSWYLFAGAELRLMAHNIFLDGNTFRDSRSVAKRYLVADVQIGAVATWNRWRVSYTHVLRGKEFDTQGDADNFGSLSVSLQF
ncbi:MAG: hypothetical protein CMK32_06165 [Porticoccaceae bacterium]|nr:hypothetical protein [Porticoccaceae bacterium]